MVEDFWKDAMNSKINYDTERVSGAAHLSNAINGFAATAYDALRDFSPMVEIFKGLGAPFGVIAIGTLCCLFVV
jgi:hypothetical protein